MSRSPFATNRARIVPKVGFHNEIWEDLLIDKEQWLVGSKDVNVLILANMKEDTQALSETRATETSRCRIQSLLKDFGNTKGKGKILHMKEVRVKIKI